MKKLALLCAVVCFTTLAAFAVNVHLASRTVKYAAQASPVKLVKDGAKAATFPARHPKKTARGAVKAGKQIF